MKKFFKRIVNRETILYGVFGILTSLPNVGLFQWMLEKGTDYKIANIITLIVVKLTAYVLNKNFVFCSHCSDVRALCKEFYRFVLARGATMLIDYFGLILLVEAVMIPKLYGKIIVTVLVVVLNYILGKTSVFKDVKSKNSSERNSI